MRLLAWIAGAAVLGAVAGLWLEDRLAPPARGPAGADPAWEAFAYEVLDRAPAGAFDVIVHVQRPAAAQHAPAGLRILLHYRDPEEYLAFTLRKDATALVRVEAGLEHEVARVDRGALPGPGEARAYRVQWRDPGLALLADGALVLAARVHGVRPGTVGVGRAGEGLTVGAPVVQQVAPVAFTDDFMRAPEDASAWEAGASWTVRSIENPARSSNAFVYQCNAPTGSHALVGRAHWDAYRAGVSVTGPPGGAMGLLLHARDADNGFLVRWSADSQADEDAPQSGPSRPEAPEQPAAQDAADKAAADEPESQAAGHEPPAEAPDTGGLELVHVRDGRERVLARARGGYRPGQWYRLEVVAGEGRAQCLVDGHEMFRVGHPALWGGRAGLYARGHEPVEFDDFEVQSYLGGFGEVTHVYAQAAGGPELYGRPGWSGYRFAADLSFPYGRTCTARMLAAYRSPFDTVVYKVTAVNGRPARHALVRVDGDPQEARVLAEAPLPEGEGGLRGRARIVLDRGLVRAQTGGALPLYAYVGGQSAGQCGFAADSQAVHGAVDLAPVLPVLPITRLTEIFDEERLMAAWSGAAGDWRQVRSASDRYRSVYWHRALLYGETEIEALLGEDGDRAARSRRGPEREVSLGLAQPPDAQDRLAGYVLRYRPDADAESEAEHASALVLFRQGAQVASADLSGAGGAHRLRLRRGGPFVVAYVDDREALVFRDPEPLSGTRVGWAARGVRLGPAQVVVYNAHQRTELFNSAPVDWRVGSGVWEVTNRWECDPRWSFWAGMTGPTAQRRAQALLGTGKQQSTWRGRSILAQYRRLPDPDEKHVVLWHKESFSGDLMVEVYMAQMMDRARGGYEKYMRDFNVTICADGRDLSTGYSCIFGGWKGEPGHKPRSAIVRAGEVVAEQPGAIPSDGSTHRRWVRLRVERHGPTVTFSAHTEHDPNKGERELARLSYTDPEPLAGTRVAIWSYDCSVLLARARIAAREVGAAESPLADWPDEVHSVYRPRPPEPQDGEPADQVAAAGE